MMKTAPTDRKLTRVYRLQHYNKTSQLCTLGLMRYQTTFT